MKNRINTVILLAFTMAVSAACTKSDNSGTINNVSPIITTGTWRVSLFSERGTDETSDFSGYTFTFQSDGKLLVQKGGSTVKQGTWSENNSSGKLIIDLGLKDNTNKPLGELTDDWILTAKSDTKISLTDDNASRNELLEFSKN